MKPLYLEVSEILEKHGAPAAMRADIDALFNEEPDEEEPDKPKGAKDKGRHK